MAQMAEKMLLNKDNKLMIVQCATFSKSMNPRNINKSVSDIRIRIRFPFQIRFWISVSGCKLTILLDTQPANRILIISGVQQSSDTVRVQQMPMVAKRLSLTETSAQNLLTSRAKSILHTSKQ